MKRFVYRAQIKNEDKLTIDYIKKCVKSARGRGDSSGDLMLSVFKLDKCLFLYYECADEDIFPENIFVEPANFLECWPGEEQNRYWVPMMDIYHYHTPVNNHEWARKTNVEKRIGRLVRLKPEYVSSYIYHHYQKQEEMPGDGNKYGIICIHENLLFFYTEEPTVIETPKYKGKLDTKNSPLSTWQELMTQHFVPWENTDEDQRFWRYAEFVLSSSGLKSEI